MREANDSRSSGYTGASEGPASPTHRPAWRDLEQQVSRLAHARIVDFFSLEPNRFGALSLQVNGLIADFSRQAIDLPALDALHSLASQSGLAQGIRALRDGELVNFTEGRAALHMALRSGCPVPAEDAASVNQTEQRLRRFAERVRNGTHCGATGKPIHRVINLGIGGSDLGPRLVYAALKPCAARAPKIRFVANIDPHDLDTALDGVDPAHTLFIVSSKSFSTSETLANAEAAKRWLQSGLGADADLSPHFVAVSNAVESARAFGIGTEHIFALPEWVGGRFSLWSTIGLPLLIGLGEAAFDALRGGGKAMDTHFLNAPLDANLPVRMALMGLWNTDFLGIETLVALPYAHALRHFPAWLQQLEMESNGKRCLRDGSTSEVNTAPLILGSTGSIGQHSFHQLFYQGTRRVALDFVAIAPDADPRRRSLFENALAQAAALTHGRDLASAHEALAAKGLPEQEIDRLAPHLVCPGNQPSTTLLLPRLDAFQLGQLLALYEHKIFVQGWIWGINSFDQYGVELGKEMARSLAQQDDAHHDPATLGLLAAARRMASD
jgi:glucose-6-phosphate isomerase